MEEPNTYPGKEQNVCGAAVKWSELKLEVMVDGENTTEKFES